MPSSLGLAWALDPGDIPSTARRHSAPACGPEPPPVATAVRDRRAGPAHSPPHGIASSVAPRRSPGGDEDRGSRAWIRGSHARRDRPPGWLGTESPSRLPADRPCHLRRTSAAGRGPPRRRDPPPTGPITSPSLRHSVGIFRHNVAHPEPSPTLNGGQGPDGVPTAAAEHYRADAYLFSVRPRAATGGPRAGLGLLRVRACLAYDARRAWPVCPRSTPGIASRRGREPRGFEQPAACTGFVRLAESGLGPGNPPPSCSYPNAAPPGLTVSGGFR
jgi:hypothetical protein